MHPLRLTTRVAPLVLLVGVALSGCGDDDAGVEPQAAPTSSAPTSSAPTSSAPTSSADAPSAEPSPTPSGPDRSPAALMELLEFSAPEFEDPVVQEAVDGYEEYLRQFVVAQGLPDADHPPLIAALDPEFAEAALTSTVESEQAGFFFVGPYVERVVDGAGSGGQVLLTSCADLSGRQIHRVSDGEFVQDAQAVVTPVTVTMTKVADRWVLSDYQRNEDVMCP